MINTDNPYQTPSTQSLASGQHQSIAFSTRSMRYATLGALVGVGFGFAVLAFTIKSSFGHRSLDGTYVTIDYVSPLVAFAFWSISAGTVFSVLGGVLGYVADRLPPLAVRRTGSATEVFAGPRFQENSPSF